MQGLGSDVPIGTMHEAAPQRQGSRRYPSRAKRNIFKYRTNGKGKTAHFLYEALKPDAMAPHLDKK